jgi:hypothetical protein
MSSRNDKKKPEKTEHPRAKKRGKKPHSHRDGQHVQHRKVPQKGGR